MRKMVDKKGITLIALVITIIVLLILAGITINLTIGQDGIINMAQKVGQNTQNSQIKENEAINNYETEINKYLPTAEKLVAEKFSFIPEDSNWNVENIKQALDYLYDNL